MPRFESLVRQSICKHFDEDEIKAICFDLNLPYADFLGDSFSTRVQEVIQHLQRRNELYLLVDEIKKRRPQINFDKQFSEIDIAEFKAEYVVDRKRIYKTALQSAEEGTKARPIRRVKIYAPLGFLGVDEDKNQWLSGLKELVVQRRVLDIEAIYGLPDDKTSLAQAANFLMRKFYYAAEPQHSEILHKHTFISGIRLGGKGFGQAIGVGMLIIGDRLALQGYAISRGDKNVQRAIVLRSREVVSDLSEWFSNHPSVENGSIKLHDPDANLDLPKELSLYLSNRGLSEKTIQRVLGTENLTDLDVVDLAQ